MIERDIEAAVVAKVAALGLSGVSVDGFWQRSAAGTVKGQELPEHSAFVRITAGLRSFGTFSSPKADVPVAISIGIREETSPDGAAVADFAAPVAALLQRWQSSVDAVKRDFAVKGFSPCGIRIDGGDVAVNDSFWTVVHRFTVRGIVTEK